MGQPSADSLLDSVKGFTGRVLGGSTAAAPAAAAPSPSTLSAPAPLHDISLPNESGYRDDRLPLDPTRMIPTRAEAARESSTLKRPTAPRSLSKGR